MPHPGILFHYICFMMPIIHRTLIIVILLAMMAPATGLSAPEHEWILGPWKFMAGDNPEYRDPACDDSAWQQVRNRAIPRNPEGVKWLRIWLPFREDAGPLQFSIIDLQSAYEIWWDGQLLARNGLVGQDEEKEVAGKIYYSFLIDGRETKKGTHLLAIRYSNFHDFSIDDYYVYASLSDGKTLGSALNRYLIRHLLYFGICLSAFLIGIALFAGGGRFKPYIYFSLVVLPSWLIYGFFALMYTINFPSWFSGVKQLLYILLGSTTYFFIGLFFLNYFSVPKKRLVIAAILSLLLAEIVFNWYGVLRSGTWQYYLIESLINLVNIGILVYGIKMRKPGGWIFLCAYLIYFATLPLELSNAVNLNYYFIYAIAFMLFIFIIFFTVTVHLRFQTKEQRHLEARAARLESEILKKAIQPHFLMNTLASLQSWSKRDPEKAARMTQAIAGEYRIINEVVSKSLVTIGEELQLCRHHLDLMGFRRDALYELICNHPCDEEMIPPLVIHTLIENGLTHAMKPRENGTFWFSCYTEPGFKRYILRNNGSSLPVTSQGEHPRHAEGTGLKYVRSRLEEAFPGKWELKYGMKEGLWEVKIAISD